jgi:3',5'-cyclic AMP phosphodiesterase CpdA
MVKLIQISDLHYGSSEFEIRYLENIIDYINEQRPDAVICTGDITHKSRKNEYEFISTYLNQIKVPLLNIMGNHDAANNGVVFFERFIGPRRAALVLDEKDTFILGVRSPRDNTSEGEVGDEQLEWMMKQFDKCNKNIKILALHHHLVAVPSAGVKRGTLVDAGEVLQLTQDYGIDLVLQGHRHVPHVWAFGKTVLVYCGTSASNKVRADDTPCFNEISIDSDKITIKVVDSLTLSKNLLFSQDRGHVSYMKSRNEKINHILNSNVFQSIY